MASPTPTTQVDACLRAAAIKHGISHQLLQAIAWQESSFNPTAIRKPHTAGGDATTDYGLMQINSSWLPTLAKYGVRQGHLYDPCVNADVGAWILASNIVQLGATWNAVGAYNARTPWKRLKYANGVFDKLKKIEHIGLSNAALTRASHNAQQSSANNQLMPNRDSNAANSTMAVFEAQAEKTE